jgi:hypothetical protein
MLKHVPIDANRTLGYPACPETLATNAGCADLRDQLALWRKTKLPVHNSRDSEDARLFEASRIHDVHKAFLLGRPETFLTIRLCTLSCCANSPVDTQSILNMVGGLSDKHVSKRMPKEYVSDFARAAVDVYRPSKIESILEHRFYLPDETRYNEEAYLQSAAELSVANYIKQRQVEDFAIKRRTNPNNKKDVDVYYRIGSTRVSVEIKCPFEEEQEAYPKYTLLPAGGQPGHTCRRSNQNRPV